MGQASLKEGVLAYGHKNILALHPTTLEITRDEGVTRRGDCIVAVRADKGLRELSPRFKEALRDGAKLVIEIECGDKRDRIIAFGDERLTLKHSSDMVIRKSDYVCDRTIAVRADKAAIDISRDLVSELRKPDQRVTIILTATRWRASGESNPRPLSFSPHFSR